MSEPGGGPVGEPPDRPGEQRVVVTTFVARSRWTVLRLRVIHAVVHRSVRRRVPGAGPAAATVDLRRRTMVSVSLWDREDDLVLVGYSGAHVWAAHWAIEHGVRAESIVYRPQGRAQELLLALLERDRLD